MILSDRDIRRALEAGRIRIDPMPDLETSLGSVSIDFRLVPDQTPEKVRTRVEAHLAQEGWHVVHEAPTAAVRMFIAAPPRARRSVAAAPRSASRPRGDPRAERSRPSAR